MLTKIEQMAKRGFHHCIQGKDNTEDNTNTCNLKTLKRIIIYFTLLITNRHMPTTIMISPI